MRWCFLLKQVLIAMMVPSRIIRKEVIPMMTISLIFLALTSYS